MLAQNFPELPEIFVTVIECDFKQFLPNQRSRAGVIQGAMAFARFQAKIVAQSFDAPGRNIGKQTPGQLKPANGRLKRNKPRRIRPLDI